MSQRPPDTMFASKTLLAHWIRGAVGLIAFVAAFALVGAIGPVSLLLLVLSVLAWRGCPTCWALGLTRTRAVRDSAAACAACPPPRTAADGDVPVPVRESSRAAKAR